jgi:hypothetical protein
MIYKKATQGSVYREQLAKERKAVAEADTAESIRVERRPSQELAPHEDS